MTTRLAHLTNEQVGLALTRIAASDSSAVLIEYFSREIDSRRDELERTSSDQLPILQGRIIELRTLIALLTPKPLRGAVPPSQGA